MNVSTKTASCRPEMSVDDIGDHLRSVTPRGKSIIGISFPSAGVNYAYDYREFEGIAIPITRRVFAYDENKHKVPAPVLVAIDISHVNFA